TQLKSAVSPITDALSQAIVALPAESIAVETIGAIYSAASGFKESLDQLTAGHEAGVRVRAALESTLAGLAQLPQNIDALLSGCQSMIESIDQASLALNPQPTTAPTTPPDEEEAPTLSLPDALAQLNEQYGQFQSAIAAFAQGISSAASGSAQTKLGVDALATGAATLASGIASVSEGASAMNQSVSGLPSEMNARISEMLQAYDKSSYRPTSFADERNGSIRAVQFTLRTDAIRLPQAEPEPVAEEESATFWTRLLKLFRD
ncbi:MAG: hypothetical protein LBS72_04655, partial [Oscillospiraceae bacterium]|nr:hypothetical protein [Oscillospiraceae bacterium]